MPNTDYCIAIYVTVKDERQLFDAALKHLINHDGLSEAEARDLLIDDADGEIDVSNCLTCLADPGLSWPGTEIHESSAEYLLTL